MAYYGYISRSMENIIMGETYYIKERREGWGQWYAYIKIEAVALRPSPNAKTPAWFFRLRDGTKVQRSAEGVWGTKAHVDETDAKEREVNARREANEAEFMSHIEPWLDRLAASDKWREVLRASASSHIPTDYSTGEIKVTPDEHPITIQTTTAGLKRLCLALLGDELFRE